LKGIDLVILIYMYIYIYNNYNYNYIFKKKKIQNRQLCVGTYYICVCNSVIIVFVLDLYKLQTDQKINIFS